LFIEKGRYLKLEVEKRICPFCERREVEDETHFLLHCTLYNDLRDEFFREFSNLTHTKKEDYKNNDELLKVILGSEWKGKPNYKQLIKSVFKFIKRSMKRRKVQEGVKSDRLDTVHLPRTKTKR